MKHQQITIAGKPVEVCYCYATEIAFKQLSEQDINDFIPEVADAITAERMPDVRKSIFLILAAISAFYQSHDEDMPVQDSDIMNECTPAELGKAIGTVLGLRNQFYALPAGEPTDKKGKGKKKN